MKKFTLTLLLIFGTVSALFAQQSVREDIFAFLKREGYVPSSTKTGTFCSKYRESTTTPS